MKKMGDTFSRAVLLCLSAVMILGVLAGCGGDTGDNPASAGSSKKQTGSIDNSNTESTDGSGAASEGDTSGGNSGSAGNNSTSGTKSTATKAPGSGGTSGVVMDLKGREINIVLHEEKTVDNYTKKGGSFYDSFQEAQKRFNCKFKFQVMDIEEATESVAQQALAGTASFDVSQVRGYSVAPTNALNGQYICLSDYYNFNDGVWGSNAPTSHGIYKGKQYALPEGTDPVMGVFYNKTLLTAAKQADPWTYVNSNTWNWDNFKKLAKALTVSNTQYGFVSEEPFAQFILSNGGSVINMSSSEGGTYRGDSNQAVAALEFVMGMYNEKIIPTSEDLTRLGIESSFLGMASKKIAMFPYGMNYAPYLVDEHGFKPSEIGWVYFPKGPSGKDYISPNSTTQSMFMVLKHVKNPDGVVAALADAFAWWSKNHTSKMTVDQWAQKTTFSNDLFLDFAKDKNYITMYNKLAQNSYRNHYLYNFPDAEVIVKEMWSKILTKEYTVSAGLNAYKSKITEAVANAQK